MTTRKLVPSRFDAPSSDVELSALLVRARRGLCVCMLAAVCGHLALSLAGTRAVHTQAAKPLTTQFVKREPRLTKPLELKKRPRPKRREVQREMVAVRAKVARQRPLAGMGSASVLGNLARPRGYAARAVDGFAGIVEPRSVAQAVEGTRESRDAVDMSLEMVDVEALDTGRYQAMVIEDPTDKRSIRGYLHLVLIHLATIQEMAGLNAVHIDGGIKKLVAALNENTSIEADVRASDDLSSPITFQTPWIYVLYWADFELKDYEYEAVGSYLCSGGFLFCDEGVNLATISYITSVNGYRKMYERGLSSQGLHFGKHWAFEELPSDHPLYHCYYDFDRPPMGYWWPSMSEIAAYRTDPLKAAVVQDRVAGLITRRSYVAAWYGKGWALGQPEDMTQVPQQKRAQQFGINTIIFALTQEGSITRRVMDNVR